MNAFVSDSSVARCSQTDACRWGCFFSARYSSRFLRGVTALITAISKGTTFLGFKPFSVTQAVTVIHSTNLRVTLSFRRITRDAIRVSFDMPPTILCDFHNGADHPQI